MEILTILEGTGEAWEALTTYGVHVSPERTVHIHGSGD
jgi:hypothetical protein